MFHSFLNSLARPKYLSFFSLSLNFTLCSARTAKFRISQILFLFIIIIIILILSIIILYRKKYSCIALYFDEYFTY